MSAACAGVPAADRRAIGPGAELAEHQRPAERVDRHALPRGIGQRQRDPRGQVIARERERVSLAQEDLELVDVRRILRGLAGSWLKSRVMVTPAASSFGKRTPMSWGSPCSSLGSWSLHSSGFPVVRAGPRRP